MSVILLRRHSIPEHDACGNRICSLDIRVVETFDMFREDIHSELLLKRFHDHMLVGIRISMFLLFQRIETHFLCVSRAQLQQSKLVSSHRHAEFHAFYLHVRHERNHNLL